jgi:hypothetical protein
MHRAPRPRIWCLLGLALTSAAAPARAGENTATLDGATERWFASGEVGTVLLGRSARASDGLRVGRGVAVGLTGGRRWGAVDLFAQGEANYWSDVRSDNTHDSALAVDLGLGGAVSYAHHLLRTSLAVGTSILAVPTDVDQAGSVGVYVDLRPVGYRWALDRAWAIGIQPLSLTVALPVLTGIPLVEIQFRSSLALEYRLP